MTNEELVRHAYNCGVAWALKSETALTVDQFIEANLTPVQSGGVIENWKLPTGNVCFNCGRELNVHSSTGQYCPNDGKSTDMWKNTRFVPIPAPTPQDFSLEVDHRRERDLEFNQVAPTPQPEVRGMDLSDLVHWCINKLFDADLPELAKEAQYYLAHLQQAPQGMDLNVIESALRFIADRHDTPIIQKNEAQKALLSIRKIPKATIACCATCEFRGVKTSEDGFNHCQKFSVDSDKACFENGYRHWSPAPVKGDDQQKDVQK